MVTYGIDEVGRGCWAGPLVVAGVGLAQPIEGLADSKKLSAKKRAVLLKEISADYNHVIIQPVKSADVDRLGLTIALKVACRKIFSEISKRNYDRVIIDGNINFLADQERTEAVVRADSTVPACMAASIAAKEWRDHYMRKLGELYPAYGFEQHVGYGTKQHKAAIEENGVIDEHRRSFKPVKDYINRNRSSG